MSLSTTPTAQTNVTPKPIAVKPTGRVQSTGKLEWIRVRLMMVDSAVQKSLRPSFVDYLRANFDPDLFGIPALVRRPNGLYHVADGQHRIEAVRAMGWGDQLVQCEVFESKTRAEEAAIFIDRENRRHTTPQEKYRISLTAGKPMQIDIEKGVRSLGLTVSNDRKDGHIRAVGALYYVYKRDRMKIDLLCKVLATLKTVWGNSSASFEGKLIEGLANFYIRYGMKVDQKSLYERLAAARGGPVGIMARARMLMDTRGTTLARCVGAIISDTYNAKRHGKTKLPDFFA